MMATTLYENGSVSFFNDDEAAMAVMASMVRLEAARLAQQQQSAESLMALNRQGEEIVVTATTIALLLGAVGTLASVAGATAAVTSAGVGIAGLASRPAKVGDPGLDSLEILIENRTGAPIVLQSYSTEELSAASMPAPIEPGQGATASIIATSDDGSFQREDSKVTLKFLVGGGLDETQQPLTPIGVTCALSYNGDGFWVPGITVDGTSDTAKDKAQAFAAAFSSTSDQVLDFTVAAQGLEKGTAEAWFYFLPSSAPLQS
jgi:hypothetical protein